MHTQEEQSALPRNRRRGDCARKTTRLFWTQSFPAVRQSNEFNGPPVNLDPPTYIGHYPLMQSRILSDPNLACRFCSQDGVKWLDLQPVAPETAERCARLNTGFTGDAAHTYEIPEPAPETETLPASPKEGEEGEGIFPL
jgi:hypothetical protein